LKLHCIFNLCHFNALLETNSLPKDSLRITVWGIQMCCTEHKWNPRPVPDTWSARAAFVQLHGCCSCPVSLSLLLCC